MLGWSERRRHRQKNPISRNRCRFYLYYKKFILIFNLTTGLFLFF